MAAEAAARALTFVAAVEPAEEAPALPALDAAALPIAPSTDVASGIHPRASSDTACRARFVCAWMVRARCLETSAAQSD